MLAWLVSIADTILAAVFTFVGFFILVWTFTMAQILQDENGQILYCETSDTGVENCYMRTWSPVD